MPTITKVISDLKKLPKGTRIMFDVWTEKDVVTAANQWNLDIDSKDIPAIMKRVMDELDADKGITFDVVSEACLNVAYPSWEYDEVTGMMYELDDTEPELNGFEGLSDEEKEAVLEGLGMADAP